MRDIRFVLALCLALAAPMPAFAACDDTGEECSRLDRLLGDLLTQIDPWYSQLQELLGDLSGWHAPEVLPNGDILIRRRQPVTPDEPEVEDPPVTDPLEL